MRKWLGIARRRDVRLRAVRVAAVVGTILMLINQGDVLLQGSVSVVTVLKIVLTYCVPYSVSTYASVEAIRSSRRGEAGESGSA